jgi:hypothetical protein
MRGYRASVASPFLFKGKEIPKYEIKKSAEYSRIPTGRNGHFRAMPTRETLTEMREELLKMSKPVLLLPERTDALHTFVLPKAYFLVRS